MTHTTEIEFHRERAIVHFGSPDEVVYWKPPENEDDKKPMKYVTKFRKKGIR